MDERESGLFRKSTLERVSSPEQLNEYIKVNNPSLILMLVGLFVIVISGFIWMFSGGIPETVNLNGVIIEEPGRPQEVCCYVPISTSKRLKEGMDVQISPDYAGREEYGYVNGKITSVGKDVVTSEYLQANFENPQVVLPAVQMAAKEGNVVEIRMSVGEWSNEKGKQITLSEGANCTVQAVVGETKAYQFIINS
ncbi:MAG: hypothetical protein Q4D57_02620 [Clostridia bacterium]|nr:hypothetical protein [Clostridia bacterium]